MSPDPDKKGQRGQSLVEFALSSVVLLLLVGGLVDIGRAIYITEGLSSAAREGARHGAWFDAPWIWQSISIVPSNGAPTSGVNCTASTTRPPQSVGSPRLMSSK